MSADSSNQKETEEAVQSPSTSKTPPTTDTASPSRSSDSTASQCRLNPHIESWRDKGKFDKFRDYQIFYYKQDGLNPAGPLVLLLHGYPSSSYDWIQYLELERENSILAIDLLGFGLSDKPPTHDYSLLWQADLVEEMVRRHNPIPNGPVFIVAHDMSTSVASEIFARDIEGKLAAINVIGALLFNGNMIMEKAKLILGQKLLRTKLGPLFSRLSNSIIYRWQLGSVFSREHPLSREEGEDQWILQTYNGGHRILHKLISYTYERVTKAERWHGAIKDWKKPLSFAWGLADPVSPLNQFEGWKDLRPHADAHEMSGLGHYPQIENPKVFKDVIDAVLEKLLSK
ncbi:hypothetical protein Ocin01_13055 [Orchesella cincta]|uniref:AB hydrolase-1 domain-containing protein n=1 Tax=Orchesella cincta TaxID=48709 RepID=A0A1D2MKQ0_ORCCI|nr:hypothetical protein Ocin01_13055 [Orchesella cincta]